MVKKQDDTIALIESKAMNLTLVCAYIPILNACVCQLVFYQLYMILNEKPPIMVVFWSYVANKIFTFHSEICFS